MCGKDGRNIENISIIKNKYEIELDFSKMGDCFPKLRNISRTLKIL